MPQINFKKRGMTMIEAIVALLIVGVTGAAIVLLISQISSVNNSSRLKNQATSYVDQALETVRGFNQKSGWTALALKGSAGGTCYSDGSLVTPTSCIPSGGAPTTCPAGGSLVPSPVYAASYTQSVKIAVTGGQISVISTICWLDKGLWLKSESNTYFYDY